MQACDSLEIKAETLREIRRLRGLTQADIASLIGIAPEQVSRIEGGERKLTHAERLVLEAALLGQPVPEV
jgi:transcriptional regulator with XRE-family HTH domain